MIDDGQNEMAFEKIAPALARAQSFTYPLMYESGGAQEINLFASGFFIRVNGREYLISAAHALKDFDSSKNRLLTRGSSSVIHIPENIISTALDKNGQDHLDMAIIEIPSDFSLKHGINVVDASMFVDSRSGAQNSQRILTGYPASRNKSVVSKKNVLHLYVYAFADIPDAGGEVNFKNFKKSPEDHVVIQLQDGISNRGAHQNVPISPKGMSGGPMWKVPIYSDSEEIFLEGVFIEMHNRANMYYGFATKLAHVLGFIRQLTSAR